MTTLLRDARFGLRLLLRSPGFTTVAVLALALGIAANSAIFSVIYATYLEPLPLRNADRLVMVWSRVDGNRNVVSPADYLEWKRQATVPGVDQLEPGLERQIVGVYADVRNMALNEIFPAIELPFWQVPWPQTAVAVRTAGEPMGIRQSIAALIYAMDPNLPMANVRTMEQIVSDSMAADRFKTALFGSFAAVALLLALIGVALGSIGALYVARAMQGILQGVGAVDPTAYVAVTLTLLGAALVACLVPAARAASVDPMIALRQE